MLSGWHFVMGTKFCRCWKCERNETVVQIAKSSRYVIFSLLKYQNKPFVVLPLFDKLFFIENRIKFTMKTEVNTKRKIDVKMKRPWRKFRNAHKTSEPHEKNVFPFGSENFSHFIDSKLTFCVTSVLILMHNNFVRLMETDWHTQLYIYLIGNRRLVIKIKCLHFLKLTLQTKESLALSLFIKKKKRIRNCKWNCKNIKSNNSNKKKPVNCN